MSQHDTVFVIREGLVPGKGGYLTYEDGFHPDARDAFLMGNESEARTTLEGMDGVVKARIVRVDITWTETEPTAPGPRQR